MDWLNQKVATLDQDKIQAAQQRQAVLTKPAGSLGQLETIAVRLAGMQGTLTPALDKVQITVFAGDHGITEEKVSAFPQAVTAQMLENFVQGGAAISVLAEELGARMSVVDVGVNAPESRSEKIINKRIIDGTANFSRHPAMSAASLEKALQVGREMVEQGLNHHMQLFIGGEMGIGNTTSATALAASLLESSVEDLVGPGTGLNESAISHKSLVIQEALYLHRNDAVTTLDKLRYFSGVEIAALVGAYLSCAQKGVPVLIDGFIASVAALYAQAIQASAIDWFIFSHQSKEPGHAHILEAMQATPILDLQMRLGEGSGAAVVVPILRNACALHNKMATFEQAGVENKEAE